MPLRLPRAVSVNDFKGGYNATANYLTLKDNETDNAANCYITKDGSVRERRGYRRRLNSALTNDGIKINNSDSLGRRISGHFQMIKNASGFPVKKEAVAAGAALYTYTSSTASIIATTTSGTQWQFSQIQDPRSASDDIMVMTNGQDNVKIWNGVENSAVDLSAVTSATQVPIAKFVNVLKNRVYLLNVVDNTDADSNVKVFISSFSTGGAPRPQRFEDNFYVGGSDIQGEITGHVVLHDQLIIFKRNATFKFTPGTGIGLDTNNLVQMDENIGCIAANSVAVAGNFVIFLSELGPYGFDGNEFVYLGRPIENDLINTNKILISKARGVFYRSKNEYWLSVPSSSAEGNDTTYIFDLDDKIWYPPITGMTPSVLSVIEDTDNVQRVIVGDPYGFIHKADLGFSDGVTATYTGFVQSVTSEMIINNSDASFPTDGDGIGGTKLRIIAGTGEGKEYTVIESSSTETLKIASDERVIGLDTTSQYVIGAIDSFYRTKDYSFGTNDTVKKFKEATLRITQEGDHSLAVSYIVDFKPIDLVPTSTISLKSDGAIWDSSTYSIARYGGTSNINKRVRFRSTKNQSLTGKNLSLLFSNQQPFQPWEVRGFDIILREVGRR